MTERGAILRAVGEPLQARGVAKELFVHANVQIEGKINGAAHHFGRRLAEAFVIVGRKHLPVEAGDLDLTRAYMAANGLISIKAKNLVSSSHAIIGRSCSPAWVGEEPCTSCRYSGMKMMAPNIASPTMKPMMLVTPKT